MWDVWTSGFRGEGIEPTAGSAGDGETQQDNAAQAVQMATQAVQMATHLGDVIVSEVASGVIGDVDPSTALVPNDEQASGDPFVDELGDLEAVWELSSGQPNDEAELVANDAAMGGAPGDARMSANCQRDSKGDGAEAQVLHNEDSPDTNHNRSRSREALSWHAYCWWAPNVAPQLSWLCAAYHRHLFAIQVNGTCTRAKPELKASGGSPKTRGAQCRQPSSCSCHMPSPTAGVFRSLAAWR